LGAQRGNYQWSAKGLTARNLAGAGTPPPKKKKKVGGKWKKPLILRDQPEEDIRVKGRCIGGERGSPRKHSKISKPRAAGSNNTRPERRRRALLKKGVRKNIIQ